MLYEYVSGQCSSSEQLLFTSPQDFFLAAARELLACTRVSSRCAARSLQLTIAHCIIADSSGVQRKTQMGIIFGASISIVYFKFYGPPARMAIRKISWNNTGHRLSIRWTADEVYMQTHVQSTLNNGSCTNSAFVRAFNFRAFKISAIKVPRNAIYAYTQ